jgi:hypothetical protein
MSVSIKTAKRIAVTLGNLLRRYEEVNGGMAISAPKTTKDNK